MKSMLKLPCLIALVSLPGGVHLAMAQPTLGVASAGSQVVLYFATTPTNYILQSTTNLASPDWVTATDAVMVTAATVSNTSPAKFFRLFYTDPPAGMALVPAGPFTIGNSIGDSD